MSTAESPVSQLLERNLSLFAGKRLLVAGFWEDDYLCTLAATTTATTLLCTDYHRFRQLQARPVVPALRMVFDHALPAQDAPFDALLVCLPKAKRETGYLLATLTPWLSQGADLFLAGENRGGINSADRFLAPYADSTHKLDSARRCSLVHATLDKPVAAFDADAWVQRYPLQIGERTLQILALPGVFSADELDEGTALLLDHLPPLKGRVLDLGCGAGVIGAWLAARQPNLQVELCDINALALESARRTLAANGLSATVYASDMLSDVQGPLAALITNPPFHAGLNTLYAPTEQMIREVPSRLARGGQLWLVANAFLRYPPHLQAVFARHEVAAENRRFRVYQAS